MKKTVKFILFAVIALHCSFSLNAQEKPNKFLDKLSVTGQFGLLHSWGDFREDGIFPGWLDLDRNEFGVGLLANYKLSNVFTISGGILYGKLKGSYDFPTSYARTNTNNLGNGIYFETNLFEITLPRIDVNLTRLIFKDNVALFNKFSLGLFLSHGLVKTDAQIYSTNGDMALFYTKDRGISGVTNEAVSAGGLSVSYILNDKFDLGVETSMRKVWNDRVDAWVTEGSSDDFFSYTALNIIYHLKSRNYVVKEFDIEEEKVLAEEKVKEETETVVEEVKNEISDNKDVTEKKLDSNLLFGKFTYKKQPLSSTAILVLNENGDVVDTIYTNANGVYEYKKLAADNFTFVPMNIDKLEEDDVILDELDANGNELSNLVYDESKEIFVKKTKKDEIVEKVEPKVEPKTTLTIKSFEGDKIYFGLNESNETDAIKAQVKSIAEKLNKYPNAKIKLAGYTDMSGPDAYNNTLSNLRAKWVKDMLVIKYKIAHSRISIVGMGSKGATKDIDPKSRRVEVISVD
jgi:outer membrane protein OmpA-like peptidoglycan-associated protein